MCVIALSPKQESAVSRKAECWRERECYTARVWRSADTRSQGSWEPHLHLNVRISSLLL